MTTRIIQKTSARARNDATEILEFIFAIELLDPSDCLWIVSPWLTDIPVLDNRSGAYKTIVPDLPQIELRLSRLLTYLAERGTHIVIATRPSEGGASLGRDLFEAAPPERVSLHHADDLHSKGIVGKRFAFTGSMNLTHNGIDRLTEILRLESDPTRVAEIRIQFREEYGGPPD